LKKKKKKRARGRPPSKSKKVRTSISLPPLMLKECRRQAKLDEKESVSSYVVGLIGEHFAANGIVWEKETHAAHD
jgi:hypothetical protein